MSHSFVSVFVCLFIASFCEAAEGSSSNFVSYGELLASNPYDTVEEERSSAEEGERQAFRAALKNLEQFMQAGTERNVKRGAQLMSAFYVDSRYAINETRRLFLEQRTVLSSYQSIANDVYGYQFDRNRMGVSVEFEGGIETSEGIVTEYAARMVFRDDRWLIASLEID